MTGLFCFFIKFYLKTIISFRNTIFKAPPRYLVGYLVVLQHNLLPFPFFHARGPAIFILIFLQLKIYLINILIMNFILICKIIFYGGF